MTIANMAIEAGGKAGLFEVDDKCREYVAARARRTPVEYHPDADAEYKQIIKIDAAEIEPCVSWPHLPSNTHPVAESRHIAVDQAVIGSCTNGRIEDMRAAAEVLRGRTVAENVRCIVIPATQKVWLQCVHEGLMDVFINAHCVVSTPTCGPCLGGYMGILAAGRALRFLDQPQLRGPHGRPHVRGLPGKPCRLRRFCRRRPHCVAERPVSALGPLGFTRYFRQSCSHGEHIKCSPARAELVASKAQSPR